MRVRSLGRSPGSLPWACGGEKSAPTRVSSVALSQRCASAKDSALGGSTVQGLEWKETIV